MGILKDMLRDLGKGGKLYDLRHERGDEYYGWKIVDRNRSGVVFEKDGQPEKRIMVPYFEDGWTITAVRPR